MRRQEVQDDRGSAVAKGQTARKQEDAMSRLRAAETPSDGMCSQLAAAKKKKARSNSKREKQWDCFPVGRCFPASTKKAPTGKQLQNKSVCWKHLTAWSWRFPMSWISKQQNYILNAVLRVPPLRGQHQVGVTLNWNTLGQCVRTLPQGSPPVRELQLSHLPHSLAAALLHARSIAILASAHRHEPRSPHRGKLSSPCPAPRLAIAICYSSPSRSTHSLSWFFFMPPSLAFSCFSSLH